MTKQERDKLREAADEIIEQWLENEMFGHDEGDENYARLKNLIVEKTKKFIDRAEKREEILYDACLLASKFASTKSGMLEILNKALKLCDEKKYSEGLNDHRRLVSYFNRIGNVKNEYQTPVKRVLCCCSAGLLRSPTAAVVLSQEPFNFNTRAAGLTDEFALIKVDDVLLNWADEIVCMDHIQTGELERRLKAAKIERPIHVLNIPDQFRYRDPALMRIIAETYASVSAVQKEQVPAEKARGKWDGGLMESKGEQYLGDGCGGPAEDSGKDVI